MEEAGPQDMPEEWASRFVRTFFPYAFRTVVPTGRTDRSPCETDDEVSRLKTTRVRNE